MPALSFDSDFRFTCPIEFSVSGNLPMIKFKWQHNKHNKLNQHKNPAPPVPLLDFSGGSVTVSFI
jgi:hypothetical protein